MDKPIIFVPACLLCPSLQANSKSKSDDWASKFRRVLLNSEANIISMPCPESSFGGFTQGLARFPHGVKYYESLPGFKEHCSLLAHEVADEIRGFIVNKNSVICILGIEHSPTCAASYMYTNYGTIHRKGIFLEMLDQYLQECKISIPFAGINRRYPQKSIDLLTDLIKSNM